MKNIFLASLLIASSSIACAEITVKDPWVRATVPQQQSTGAFMQIGSTTDVRLISAQSSVAKIVEIHEMTMDNNVMKMREIGGVDIPSGKTIELKPGSYHVMLIYLKQQVKDGDVVPVTLIFEGKNKKKETVEVKALARPLNTPSANQVPAHSH